MTSQNDRQENFEMLPGSEAGGFAVVIPARDLNHFRSSEKAFLEFVEAACADGQWNLSDYNRGCANALIVARNIMTGTNTKMIDDPIDGYLMDRKRETVPS